MADNYIPLTAPKRVPFDVEISELGVDYSGATMLMHIRTEPGGTGDPLIALSNASPPSQGLSVTYDADLVDPEGKLPDGGSKVRIIISEATLEGLPAASPASSPLTLYYDIHLTPVAGFKRVFSGGEFIVTPGVTV